MNIRIKVYNSLKQMKKKISKKVLLNLINIKLANFYKS